MLRKVWNRYFAPRSRPYTRRPARHSSRRLVLEALEDRTVPSSITFSGSGPQNGFTNSAQAIFDLTGTTLTVTLTNTATQTFDATHVLQPSNVLSGVLFDISGNTNLSALTPGNANLASGSRMVLGSTTSLTDTSASGWGYGVPQSGSFNGQHYGIEAFGGISTANLANFANSNTSPNHALNLDGIDYGIVDSNYVPGTGNGGIQSHFPYEQTAEVFRFTVASGTFTDVSQIGNVSFQYGTSNGEAAFVGRTSAITTSANPTSGPEGITLNDTATLSSPDESQPVAGSITFTLYDPNNHPVYTETDSVNAFGSITTTGPGTGSRVATEVGTYEWVANFTSTNSNYPNATSNFGDEPVDISPAQTRYPSGFFTTTGGDVTLGTGTVTLNDSATVTNHDPAGIGGNVTFYLFAPGDPGTDLLTAKYTDVVPISGDASAGLTVHTSDNSVGYTLATDGSTVTGTWNWVAVYSGFTHGDGTVDEGATDTLGNEPVHVSPASPTLVTTSGGDLTLGTTAPTLTDTADLEGAYNPTGSITFTLSYAADGVHFSPVPAATQTDPVDHNGTPYYTASYPLPTNMTVAGT
jgi:hypothetical protein